ncbi:tRNA (adenosine(37)-N6)-threonylcarbamoyltransferase complex dimerization subunit type 1 TsaB [Brevundimonas viscosa]|uniref:tRNA threonylcarbamoyladenosine biosynthesis protein TsaB n=1 Tax=Brevundimonas viscosa TaxID=871741 RepID=A0A1I6P2G6_9CAUL|nr:tRNA (adenosine(37)-N6)-threonylcarbamoyltransferase complex dimerization subunit type 1 TsaB [Brevundimonas viscosa]SFS34260.1 tRNA threonylcarbamoyladenosine biosynthesis protein TsaB [Brevundimonas viscosa]
MRVMVIDTALGLCSAGIFDVDARPNPLGVRSVEMAKGHQERLGGLAREAMTEAGGLDGVERIGVTVGPGSFTGLRVGLAFAQGLGAALGRPVVGISTLDALAASTDARDVAALVDARRGQVYARFWRAGAADGPPEALSLETARERLAGFGPGAALVGSGAALLDDAAVGAAILGLAGPAPDALARLTAAADPAAAPPRPLYLRAPDATPPSRLPGQARPARS